MSELPENTYEEVIEAYIGPCQACMIELFAIIINGC